MPDRALCPRCGRSHASELTKKKCSAGGEVKSCRDYSLHSRTRDGLETSCRHHISARRTAKTLAAKKLEGRYRPDGVIEAEGNPEPLESPIWGRVGKLAKPAAYLDFPTRDGWAEFMIVDGWSEYGDGEWHRLPMDWTLTQAVKAKLVASKFNDPILWADRYDDGSGWYYHLLEREDDEALWDEIEAEWGTRPACSG